MFINDITLVASYRKDSDQREQNRNNFTDFYTGVAKFDILETHDSHNIMRNYNDLACRCTTKYIAFIDIDVMLPPEQIRESIKLLETSNTSFVSPFDQFYNIHEFTWDEERNIDVIRGEEEYNERLHNIMEVGYYFKRNISYIGEEKTRSDLNVERNSEWESPFFVGLCVITELDTYYKFGMGNENFLTYGGADDEWYARAETLGYNWEQVPGSIYHIHHDRIPTSNGKLLGKNNMIELIKSTTFTKEELEEYMRYCHWNQRCNPTMNS